MKAAPHIAGLILAGGRGQRMAGVDKGLVSLWGQPMVAHVVARLTPQVDTLIISSNRNRDAYIRYSETVLADASDEAGELRGPLAGMLAGLKAADSDYLLVVPCDAPCLPADLARRMMDAMRKAGAKVAMASDGERTHYTTALIATSLADDLAAYLAEGGRKVGTWLARCNAITVDFSDSPGVFVNVNTPEALATLETAGGCGVDEKGR